MIGRLNHVAVVVPDLADAARVYRETLGADVSSPVDLPEHGVTTVFVALPNSKIELLHPLGENSPIRKFLDRRGPGLHHLCLASDSLAGDDRKLRQLGYRLLREEPTRGAGGCWVQFVHPQSASGVLVELSQKD